MLQLAILSSEIILDQVAIKKYELGLDYTGTAFLKVTPIKYQSSLFKN